jgi:hypothetical protein
MYEMRLLKAYTTQTNLKAECWCIHRAGDPGNSVLQVDLFVANDGKWHAWTGCYIRPERQALANGAAETRNALQFP